MLRYEAIGPGKQWSASTILRGFRQYQEAMRIASVQSQTGWLDLEKKIPKNLDIFIDDVHYTEAGYDQVADKITHYLIRHIPQYTNTQD